MNYKNITIAGSGVLGSQIAFQVAFKGFNVSVYDINDAALEAAKKRMYALQDRYMEDLKVSKAEVEAAYERLSFHVNLAEAVQDADLVVEAVPESIAIKEKFYTELGNVAPEKTIFATNSSTLVPSQFVQFTGRPEKFLTLHFCTELWIHNIAEVMGHPGTKQEHFDDMIEFATAIGMVPIPIYKEQPGYILNTLLVPWFISALTLDVNEIATPESIDKTWMISSGAPYGPFAFIDMIGLNTSYNIAKMMGDQGDENLAKIAEYLKSEFVDKGKLGKEAGEGYYSYPNPKFLDSDFLK